MASTFATHATNWYVRISGNELNGGGFCPLVTNAGTNYANQDAAQISSTTGTCTVASTTWTDANVTFTAAMIGNVIRISAKTGGSAIALDYFVVTAFTDAHNVVLDRSPCASANITAATYRLGGGFANPRQFAVGGSGAQPVLASPALPGNTYYIQGTAADGGSFDYDMSDGYYQFPNGNNTATTAGGSIKWIGFPAPFRPYIKHCGIVGGTATQGQCNWLQNIKFVMTVGTFAIGDTHQLFDSGTTSYTNCIFDAGGFDCQITGFGDSANASGSCVGCEFRNSGGGAAGVGYAVIHNHGGGFLFANWIHGMRGDGIAGVGVFGTHIFNIIANNGRYGFNDAENDGSKPIPYFFMNNTFDANHSGAMNFGTMGILNNIIKNNLFTNHATAATSALTFTDTAAVNAQRYRFIGYNDYYNNTANFNGTPAVWAINKTVDSGNTGDLTLNPSYTNAAGNDYTPTANVTNTGQLWTSAFTATTYTMPMGAIL